MSKDLQLAWPCPHRIMEEVVALGADRRSLYIQQPIAGAGSVQITANDEFFIPQGGLLTAAQLYSSVSGPFDIVEGLDTLIVESPLGQATLNFNVVGTARLSTDEVIKQFQRSRFSVGAVENVNGFLVISDISVVGVNSFIKVSGSAAPSLGFGSADCLTGNLYQRGARGAQLYPSWSLAAQSESARYPKFDFPVKANPIFKVSYTVPVTRCLRCGGTYIENDYRFNEKGQSVTVENEDLLYQACLKILLTEKGSNPYHTWYGSTIKSRIGSKAVAGVSMAISEDVRSALMKSESVQEQQAKYQTVTFKERFYSLTSVQVSPHAQDPTTFLVDVVVTNAAGYPINLSIVFTVPGVVALMGSNGLMMGNEVTGLAAEKILLPGRSVIDGQLLGS